MKRPHKTLLVIGFLLFLAAWLAWGGLLTEDEMPEADEPAAQQAE